MQKTLIFDDINHISQNAKSEFSPAGTFSNGGSVDFPVLRDMLDIGQNDTILQEKQSSDSNNIQGCKQQVNQEMQLQYQKPPVSLESEVVFKRVRSAEPCGNCRNHSVEYEVKLPNGEVWRQCRGCFEESRRAHPTWHYQEGSIGAVIL
ncbi:hypothetical protein [Candidatus Bathycorpusculum sp.]|uniref:hypothetical protein n=1 Tax=Candidatus Bathycorpusculum sp. TaxID=2994959 RepID=UPI0028223DA6|nr:hypothetical protein [Candidatus Termitimicrobium sp.]